MKTTILLVLVLFGVLGLHAQKSINYINLDERNLDEVLKLSKEQNKLDFSSKSNWGIIQKHVYNPKSEPFLSGPSGLTF